MHLDRCIALFIWSDLAEQPWEWRYHRRLQPSFSSAAWPLGLRCPCLAAAHSRIAHHLLETLRLSEITSLPLRNPSVLLMFQVLSMPPFMDPDTTYPEENVGTDPPHVAEHCVWISSSLAVTTCAKNFCLVPSLPLLVLLFIWWTRQVYLYLWIDIDYLNNCGVIVRATYVLEMIAPTERVSRQLPRDVEPICFIKWLASYHPLPRVKQMCLVKWPYIQYLCYSWTGGYLLEWATLASTDILRRNLAHLSGLVVITFIVPFQWHMLGTLC